MEVGQDPAALSFSTFQTNKAFLIRCAKGGCYSTLDFADRGRELKAVVAYSC
jgi:hypothetical protein